MLDPAGSQEGTDDSIVVRFQWRQVLGFSGRQELTKRSFLEAVAQCGQIVSWQQGSAGQANNISKDKKG